LATPAPAARSELRANPAPCSAVHCPVFANTVGLPRFSCVHRSPPSRRRVPYGWRALAEVVWTTRPGRRGEKEAPKMEDQEGTERRLSREDLLKLAAAAGGAALLRGRGGRGPGAPRRA